MTNYDDMKAQSILQISRISIEDEGSYRCISGNGLEEDLVKQVDLIIKGKIFGFF